MKLTSCFTPAATSLSCSGCNGANTAEVFLDYRKEITVGKFVDRERPSLNEAMDARMREALGAKYVPYKIPGKA